MKHSEIIEEAELPIHEKHTYALNGFCHFKRFYFQLNPQSKKLRKEGKLSSRWIEKDIDKR